MSYEIEPEHYLVPADSDRVMAMHPVSSDGFTCQVPPLYRNYLGRKLCVTVSSGGVL